MNSPAAHSTGEDQGVNPSPAAKGVRYVVDIVGLSKSFRRKTRARSGYTTVKSALTDLIFRRRRGAVSGELDGVGTTHAIKDLTLRIPAGASVGLIGRNGSGKSTFLKLVTGIYKPDQGSVTVSGRVAALIELGAGFHPDFTGRENLTLAGVMHGLSREEIAARFDDIVKFAELEHVIDDPVRTYSSGMFMRLGFSIAVHTDPDVLLVDEVLAVGDAGFIAKCKDRIAELRKQGKTLVLVTHDLDAVERWCDEVIWLHGGEVKDRGYPRRVIDSYRHFIEKGEELELLKDEELRESSASNEAGAESGEPDSHDRGQGDAVPPTNPHATELVEQRARWGSREIEIVSVDARGRDGVSHRVFHPDDPMEVVITYRRHADEKDVVFGIGIHRTDGLTVYGTNTEVERIGLPPLRESGEVVCRIERLGLLEGAYILDIAVHRADGYPFDYHKAALNFSVRSGTREVGVVSPVHSWLVHGEECRCLP